jgi:hypothetical protein
MTEPITSVHIYTVTDPATGEEGIAGIITPQGGRPLIAVNDEILEEIKPLAQSVADMTGLPVQLVQFNTRVNVEEVHPNKNAEPSTSLTPVPEGDPNYEPKLSDFESEK